MLAPGCGPPQSSVAFGGRTGVRVGGGGPAPRHRPPPTKMGGPAPEGKPSSSCPFQTIRGAR
eukprot:1609803-Alexandrium_andersonii.AAC.1